MRNSPPPTDRVVLLDGQPLDPAPAQKAAKYFRSFEWGTHSPGAALLALALLLHVASEQEALRLRFLYAAEVIVNLPSNGDTLDIRKVDIETWLATRAYSARIGRAEGVVCYA